MDLPDDLEECGERLVDPLPGVDVDHTLRVEFATTGVGLGPSGRELDADSNADADSDDDELLKALLLVDPTTLDGETAAAAAAAARRDMVRLSGTTSLSSSGAGRTELFRAAVLSGMDHMVGTTAYHRATVSTTGPAHRSTVTTTGAAMRVSVDTRAHHLACGVFRLG